MGILQWPLIKEVENRSLSYLEELLRKERQAMIGRMMPPYIHDVNGSIGAIHMLSSFQTNKVEEVKQLMKSGSLKKSDLDEFLNTIAESNLRIFQSCEHLSDFNEMLRATSNRVNKPLVHPFLVSEVLSDYVTASRGYFKKYEVKWDSELNVLMTFNADPSWLLCTISLWIHGLIALKEPKSMVLQSAHMALLKQNDIVTLQLTPTFMVGDGDQLSPILTTEDLETQIEWCLINTLNRGDYAPYMKNVILNDNGSMSCTFYKEE